MWRLGRKIHISWQIGAACLAFVGGVFASRFLPIRLDSWVWLAFAAGLLIAGAVIGRRKVVIVIIIAALVMGVWRGAIMLAAQDEYHQMIGRTVIVQGVITEDPVVASGQLSLRLDIAAVDGRRLSGEVYMTTTGQTDIKRGDTLMVRGQLRVGFGSFDAVMYRTQVKAVLATHDVIVDLRDWFAGQVRRMLPEPQASLGLGFLLGEKSALPSDLVDSLQIAGLTHVVVASGYNLTILVRLGRRLFMKVSKFSATLVSVIMILGFIGVTGLSPSMMRAGMVALLSLAAWYYGRRFHPLVLLGLVATISVAINPDYVWHDVGWGLSFVAFIGVMIGAPLLQRYFFGDKKPGVIRQILGETVAAHLLTIPLILLVFSQISHVAVISNMLVLPFVPLAMLLTFLVGIFAVIWPWLADIISWLAEHLLEYMITVIYYTADLAWAKSDISVPIVAVVGMYVAVVGVMGYLWWRTRLDLREANIVE